MAAAERNARLCKTVPMPIRRSFLRVRRSGRFLGALAVAIVICSACGSDRSSPRLEPSGTGPTTTSSETPATTRSPQAIETQAPDPETTTTTTSTPPPFPRETFIIDIGLTSDTGEQSTNEIAADIPFYASTFIVENSRFNRFSQRVGRAFEDGSYVSEGLGMHVDTDLAPEALLELLVAEISARLPEIPDVGDFTGFITDLTFGRQLDRPVVAKTLKLDATTISVGVAGGSAEEASTTVFLLVSERHQEKPFAAVQRQPSVDQTERALLESWPEAFRDDVVEWEISIYRDSDSGEVRQSLMFGTIFRAEAQTVLEDLLATGAWREHPDFPPDDQGFSVYSDIAWLQGFRFGETTSAIITVNQSG